MNLNSPNGRKRNEKMKRTPMTHRVEAETNALRECGRQFASRQAANGSGEAAKIVVLMARPKHHNLQMEPSSRRPSRRRLNHKVAKVANVASDRGGSTPSSEGRVPRS